MNTALVAALWLAFAPPASAALIVCADPANLPYSDAHETGFENKVARLLASDMGTHVEYVWTAQHRGFLRGTLLAGQCDVVISAPENLPGVATTRPWFSSFYVAVSRRSAGLAWQSFDDARLRHLRIGVQLLGSGGMNTPPAMSLGGRGLAGRVTGFPMWDEAGGSAPQGRIVEAVAQGEIDIGLVWGPFGFYFAHAIGDTLRVDPIQTDTKFPALVFNYAMSAAVRPDDTTLRDKLQAAFDRHGADIAAILASYAIPAQNTISSPHLN